MPLAEIKSTAKRISTESERAREGHPASPALRRDSRVASLFTGIGGIELGLHRAGFSVSGLRLACEIDAGARLILAARFGLKGGLHSDVRQLRDLDGAELVTAGFPCQDLSQAGLTAGIDGEKSGLVSEVFRLLAAAKRKGTAPRWVLFENVPFMLRLQSGRAMECVVQGFEKLGYRWWAYRVFDSLQFGLPQRRRRVFFLASRSPEDDPRSVLFDPSDGVVKELPSDEESGSCYGFYWTEGNRGLGWAAEAIPTLKGGSSLGIPSPPAIWFRDTNEFSTPSIELAERIQGFPVGWTDVSGPGVRNNSRWKYVGNAVPVRVAEWIGKRLLSPVAVTEDGVPFDRASGRSWPLAAFSREGKAFEARSQPEGPVGNCSRKRLSEMSILAPERRHLHVQPLSLRAASGVLMRLVRARKEGRLRPREDFMNALSRYVANHDDRPAFALRGARAR